MRMVRLSLTTKYIDGTWIAKPSTEKHKKELLKMTEKFLKA
jgi:hypothetical protein